MKSQTYEVDDQGCKNDRHHHQKQSPCPFNVASFKVLNLCETGSCVTVHCEELWIVAAKLTEWPFITPKW
jgi:hypothetical protein